MIEYTVQVWPNGTKMWHLHDEVHREDGPAIVTSSGTKRWYLHGELHREDGPAVEYPNGTKKWFMNGVSHREDGPAVVDANGTKKWFLNGVQLTREAHREQTQPEPTCDGKTVEIDGRTYVLTLKE